MLKFITGNKGKFEEIAKVFLPIKLVQANIDLAEVQEIDAEKIIRHKLSEALKHHQNNFFIEDTSLYYEALKGKLPGPLIKWFLDTLQPKGLYEMAKKLGNQKVVLRSIVAFVSHDGKIYFFKSETKGTLVKPIGRFGFGLDPIFKPLGSSKTLAQMIYAERSTFSPRIKAINKLKLLLSI